MRATTLRASPANLGGLLAYYAGLATDQRRPGRPRARADRLLPRSGRAPRTVAGSHQLEALLVARHPATGARLGRGFGPKSARAFDATFSAPKSVSLLWALSPDPFVRAEVLAAHDAAVVAALGWFEHHGAVTRRGRNGLDQVDTRGVAVAVFRQHTSRSADPQLHSHAIVAAKVQDSSGRWLSLDARFLKRQQRSIGWVGRPRPGPRAGDPAAVAAHAAHHRLQTVHPALVADRVARQFERLGARGHSVGVTTASAGTARAINVEIQRRRNPRLDGARVVLADGTTAFVGDRVATRCNVDQRTDKGAPARNRQTLDGQRRGRRRVTPAV